MNFKPMDSATAFAPGNISCIFVIRKTMKPHTSGSLGVGFTIDKGATVTVSLHKKNTNGIYYNNKKIIFPTVNSVIKKLTNKAVLVKIKSPLPLGSGFGMSGACALATAYALSSLLSLKKEKKHLAKIAHIAEVENLTGLGDVINQFYGGVLIKYEPSYKFRAVRLPIKNTPIFYQCFSGLDTKKTLSDSKKKSKIDAAGLTALAAIKTSKKDLETITKIAKHFAIESGLLQHPRLKKIINGVEKRGGKASMIMLGNAVYSTIPFKGCKKTRISDRGAYLFI